MANVLVEIPDELLHRVETKLLEVNKNAMTGKTSLTKEERKEAEALSAALGFGVGKVWVDSVLHPAVPRLSRRALIVRLIDAGLSHLELEAPGGKELSAESKKTMEAIKANQKKRGSAFA